MSGAGVRGTLLSQHFLREVLARRFATRLGEATVVRAQRGAVRWWRSAEAVLGPSSGVRAIRDVVVSFFGLLGYRLRTVHVIDDGVAVVVCEIQGAGVSIDLLVGTWSLPLDHLWRRAVRVGIASGRRWVFAFNGRALRVIDIDRPYARRHVEFALAAVISDVREFAVLWGLLRAGAASLFDEVVRASEAHGAGVRVGLQAGVRVALSRLSLALARAARRQGGRAGQVEAPAEIVAQALTLIYRLLFLLFAEARALVPIWHPIYRRSYSLAMLQRQVELRSTHGLWDAVRAISRLAHAGCRTDEFRMTAFNGRLFSPEATPLGERARISSAVIATVLRALTQTRSGAGRRCERITYGDLGVEELGAIYERVLDHVPAVEALTAGVVGRAGTAVRVARASPDIATRAAPVEADAEVRVTPLRARGRGGVADARARRRESGTFYTPRSMADYLVRETLEPLVAEATPEGVMRLKVLDPAMGSGAFLVCACRYLASAYERALDRAGRPLPTTMAERAEVRRRVARHCLFGVDVNPVAVQLARLSLWLTTLTADAPLTFLDHHLRVGDSLVGASLDDLSRRPPAGRGMRRGSGQAFPLFASSDLTGPMRALLDVRARLVVADDSPAIVRRKERLLDESRRGRVVEGWRRLADLWCASWFSDVAAGGGLPARAWAEVCDYVRGGRASLPAAQIDGWLASADHVAGRRRFFHWTLEFPEVFFDQGGEAIAHGGFDAVVGNPPWNVLRADAADGHIDRVQVRQMGRFIRESGVYEPLSRAHPNLYQLFVSRSLALLRPGGRLGLVAPWGLACDHGSARLRRRLTECCSLDTIVSFDNAARVFPVHRGLRFMLFTCTTGRGTQRVRCRLGQRDPAVLDRTADEQARGELVLTIGLLKRVSGESLAIPDVRAAIELSLLERLHARWPAIGSPDGWGVLFGRELNATDDRALMRDVRDDERGPGDSSRSGVAAGVAVGRAARMAVIEGKQIHPFRVAVDQATRVIRAEAEAAVRVRLPALARARLAYREVTFPGQRWPLVAAILPAGTVSTHTVFCLKSLIDDDEQWCLCGLLNSLVCNYLVRVRAGSHVTAALLHHLPMPRPLADSEAHRQIARLARELASASHADDDDAGGLEGGGMFGRAGRQRYARLQGLAARVYGLRDDEFVYLVGTFTMGADERRQMIQQFRQVGGGRQW